MKIIRGQSNEYFNFAIWKMWVMEMHSFDAVSKVLSIWISLAVHQTHESHFTPLQLHCEFNGIHFQSNWINWFQFLSYIRSLSLSLPRYMNQRSSKGRPILYRLFWSINKIWFCHMWQAFVLRIRNSIFTLYFFFVFIIFLCICICIRVSEEYSVAKSTISI